MDKVLKQRLVGAAILIALAVIFIPMLLEDPDRDEGPRQLTIDLPAPGEDQREIRRLPLDPDHPAGRPPAAERERPPVVSPPPTRAEPADRPPLPDPAVDFEPLPDPGPEPQAEPESAPDPEPAPPVVEPEPDPPPVESGDGAWVVQVASFANQQTARDVAARLESLGHGVQIEEIVRGPTRLHRIRTGPYRSEAEAETARGQIARTLEGVDPVVREQAGLVMSDRDGVAGYAVQVGSFASHDNARRLRDQLQSQGFDAFLHEESTPQRVIWQVRIGTFENRDSAGDMLDRIRREANLEGLVVSHP